VDLTTIAQWLEATALTQWLRGSLAALPVIESIHVMAIAVVFGSIVIIDLRLLGITDMHRPFSRVFRDVLVWTWIGFSVAAVTGVLMFVPNATTYVRNTAFGLKLLSLLGAGINMGVFELTMVRRLQLWDTQNPTPRAAKIAGIVSLVIWSCVIVFGRWIGFTKGYDYSVPDEIDFTFPG
jgi:hypothetical protein